jgi:glycosyltransferase involved in cell wall biosynthesis
MKAATRDEHMDDCSYSNSGSDKDGERKTGASVVIATRNRCEDVLRAIQSAFDQSYKPLEVLVFDDASTDGTAETVARHFPRVRLFRGADCADYIVLRNRGFQQAVGEFVFSLDDDAFFTCDRTVERTVELFEEHSKVAAIALPYVEPKTTDRRKLMRAIPALSHVRGYVGCAHALRKSSVLELGGYREFFIHQGEERDLSIRLQERGYEIIFGDSAPIVHEYGSERDLRVISYYGVRNTLLFDTLNIPLPYVVPRIVADAFNLFRYKLTWRSTPTRLRYVLSGMLACLKYRRLRKPVRRDTYKRYRALPTHGPLPFLDIPKTTFSATIRQSKNS